MRREAEQSVRTQETFVTIVSPKATLTIAGPRALLAEAAKVGVKLEHQPVDEATHAFGVPGAVDQFSIVIGYGELDEDTMRIAADSEWLTENPQHLRIGTPSVTFRGKMQLDPVVDFLGMTLSRVLGRLTHGTLITGPGGIVNDDWLSWSLDYMDADMFKVTRVYDDPPPDFQSLLNRFPQLRAASSSSDDQGKPWWRIW
ncbi:MAG: hypothetical protein GC159_00035 [Phycisphaera sp.]|nr:hypothetical protein [Phycisphaera sp.]